MKLYQYTLLKQDGTKEVMPPRKKMSLQEYYKTLNCTTIELIPTDYWKGMGYGKVTMIGDEEGRFNENNHRNPHFKVLDGGILGGTWDVVGDILMEAVYHEK